MKEIIVAIFVILGSLFLLLAATGLLRFRDTLSRLHASTKAPSFAMLFIVLSVCIYFSLPILFLKAFLLIVFIYLTAPLAAHSISKSREKGDNK